MAIKVYFAGPNVFHLRAKEMEQELIQLSRKIGIEPLIPGDTGINWSEPNKQLIAQEIFNINVNHIRNCDGVLANTHPFRGACVDDGTAWEIGFASALGKPVVSYSWGAPTTSEIIISVAGKDPHFSTPQRDSHGFLIEEFGLPANLMISCSVQKHFHLDAEPYGTIPQSLAPPLAYLRSHLLE